MVHNDVRFAKIIHTVQIELEIDLIGEYYVYFCWIDMCFVWANLLLLWEIP